MRIIAGRFKGRRLRAPGRRFADSLVRPTSDRAREALFNLLQGEVTGAAVLDLFAGTGALGLEALSRGAEQALFVEGNPSVARLLRENIELCGVAEQSRLVVRDCAFGLDFLTPLAPPAGFDLIMVDPPYDKGLAEATLARLAALPAAVFAPGAMLVVETRQQETLPPAAGPFQCRRDSRRYGEARFHFFNYEKGAR
ncbi:16S rRNA (guanine(966)-N(2))-methyltransferase RsmD [Desulfurivibrio alkaliphilus]|uniref:Methyltransferase n=1 Tax=Desulfurivibrio alkaliphilus (strain DSM 19089 / UNIQEM U267 / AHT2) TaxID=589865 RepID=D6Z0M2_DESAT|nr:16S rRNA (guanine(966)-N(2))-methyltransferase RsmD [Desulfurivibrio alkaliphilus]ADH85251.1 methyltransferase [Desulfurivibrio alkaliphilus AHT 2]